MVAVLFATVVMSLIVISFIRAMNSGLSQNVMYTTSQSVYDAAVTGLSDVQRVISECRRNPGNINSPLNDHRYGDCRAILLGDLSRMPSGFSSCQQTIIAVERILFPNNPEKQNPTADTIGVINSDSDFNSNQSYTCIAIEPNAKSYQGTLNTGSDDGTIIPISTVDNAKYALLSYGVGMTEPNQINDASLTSTRRCTSSAPSLIAQNIYGFDVDLMN